MMPNKSIYRDADAAEINLYELNFARFFSIQTSENGWRRVVCELVRRAAKGTKELRLEDGTELPGEKTFPDYVVDLMDSYLAVLPDAKPHAYPAAEREQLMERHCRHTEDGGIDYDYYQDMTLDTFIFNMRNVGAGALYAKRGPFWHGGHMEQCHFEELFRLIEEEGEKVFGETQERYADLAANDITAEAEHLICRDLLAQISKRPMPQGMDYDPKSDSYEEDVRRECGRIDFHLQELQLSLYPNEEAAPLLYPDNECASTDAFVSSYDSLNNHLKRDLNNTENTLCADDIKTLLLQNEFFARGGYKYFSTEIDDLAVWFASYGADTLSDCYKYGVGVPQSFHQAALWEQYAINLYYIYRDYYNKSDDESYRDSRLDEIGRLSVSCHIQRNLPDALYTDEQWGCISDFGCMPTELVALSRAEKPDTPYISHTSSLVMQMIQKTSLEELKQMGHTYLNYVRRNSSKNPLEDWKQAVNYYYAGAAQGDAECAAAVGYCCEMDPRGSNLPLALAWYQHAAKAGSAWAMEKVATFYEEGYGCTANRALADACRETLKYMR